MTPEDNLFLASIWIWFSGYICGIASVALATMIAIKLGFRIRRVKP